MLTRMLDHLQSDDVFNETMRVWFSAVCSLCFYSMCRINEMLMMMKGDIQRGLQHKARKTGEVIRYGCFTIRDRKPITTRLPAEPTRSIFFLRRNRPLRF